MSDLFGDDYITLTDEDGQEFEVEVLATVEYNGMDYMGVCPAGMEDESELEVSILKVVEEDGEAILEAVTDDDELEAVYNLLLEDDSEDDEEE